MAIRIAINDCFGRFSLSDAACEAMGLVWRRGADNDNGYEEYDQYSYNYSKRADPKLINVIETLGEASWGLSAKLHIVEIPNDVLWDISEYDGIETVVERHRSWR